jgi:putative oxidoreductase
MVSPKHASLGDPIFQIPELAKHYRVIAPDLRGYGETDKPRSGYNKRNMALDIVQLLDESGIGKVEDVSHCDLSMKVEMGQLVEPRVRTVDLGLLYLRVTASLLVLAVHGLPKVVHYSGQIAVIEDPFHLGRTVSILFAIFAEVICPPLMILGIATRFAALPILLVTMVALVFVHRDWSLAEGQFAWMLLILFGTIAIAGPGSIRVGGAGARNSKRRSGAWRS